MCPRSPLTNSRRATCTPSHASSKLYFWCKPALANFLTQVAKECLKLCLSLVIRPCMPITNSRIAAQAVANCTFVSSYYKLHLSCNSHSFLRPINSEKVERVHGTPTISAMQSFPPGCNGGSASMVSLPVAVERDKGLPCVFMNLQMHWRD
jgi:hypothetical protein